jgi:uncharacterized protein (DUF1697 family)
MSRFVALFRGINVGRAKRIAMADLRALLESLGYGGVRTLLNSGNAVFEGPAGPPATHARRIQAAVAGTLGVECLVIVKSAKDMAAVVAGNALAATATDPSRLLVALTQDAQALAALDALAQARAEWGGDEFHVGTPAAYLWCANGILESKLAVALLKGLATSGTTRNWATIEKINALLQKAA